MANKNFSTKSTSVIFFYFSAFLSLRKLSKRPSEHIPREIGPVDGFKTWTGGWNYLSVYPTKSPMCPIREWPFREEETADVKFVEIL